MCSNVEENAWSDMVARQLYNFASEHLNDLGATNISLQGLSVEEIGQWIKAVSKIELPLHDFKIIRERSAGFPFLLSEWINRPSNKLDYNEINGDKYCRFVRYKFENIKD